jgi:hypothetical protein
MYLQLGKGTTLTSPSDRRVITAAGKIFKACTLVLLPMTKLSLEAREAYVLKGL